MVANTIIAEQADQQREHYPGDDCDEAHASASSSVRGEAPLVNTRAR